MKQAINKQGRRIGQMAWFALLTAALSAGTAQAATVSYILDNVFVERGGQMTGAFDWTYMIGDFEGGSGEFSELELPVRPSGTLPPLQDPGMVIQIENNQIEISLDGNFHDYGLDAILKFTQSLSPDQASPVDISTSFYECCGNGFNDQLFVSGSITQVASAIPLPAAAVLFAGGLGVLCLRGPRRRRG